MYSTFQSRNEGVFPLQPQRKYGDVGPLRLTGIDNCIALFNKIARRNRRRPHNQGEPMPGPTFWEEEEEEVAPADDDYYLDDSDPADDRDADFEPPIPVANPYVPERREREKDPWDDLPASQDMEWEENHPRRDRERGQWERRAAGDGTDVESDTSSVVVGGDVGKGIRLPLGGRNPGSWRPTPLDQKVGGFEHGAMYDTNLQGIARNIDDPFESIPWTPYLPMPLPVKRRTERKGAMNVKQKAAMDDAEHMMEAERHIDAAANLDDQPGPSVPGRDTAAEEERKLWEAEAVNALRAAANAAFRKAVDHYVQDYEQYPEFHELPRAPVPQMQAPLPPPLAPMPPPEAPMPPPDAHSEVEDSAMRYERRRGPRATTAARDRRVRYTEEGLNKPKDKGPKVAHKPKPKPPPKAARRYPPPATPGESGPRKRKRRPPTADTPIKKRRQ